MSQSSWLRAYVAMFEAFGGWVPRIVSDNLKTGVIKRPRDGEIVLNDAYREMAAHYGAAVLPARVRKAKDKPSVENTAWHVAMRVIARLRNDKFASIAQLQAAIDEQVSLYNQESFQKREGSRASVFIHEEQPLMTPLPQVSYEISTWVYGRKVQRNAHVVWEKNFYSAPISHIGTSVDLRITATELQIYAGQQRISSHVLPAHGTVNQYSTNPGDIPTGKHYQPWDTERIRDWAQRVGPSTTTVINRIFESVAIDEQGFDAALAILRLTRCFSADRVEAACCIALSGAIRSPRYVHINPILITGQDIPARHSKPSHVPAEEGGFVRGADYYAGGTQ